MIMPLPGYDNWKLGSPKESQSISRGLDKLAQEFLFECSDLAFDEIVWEFTHDENGETVHLLHYPYTDEEREGLYQITRNHPEFKKWLDIEMEREMDIDKPDSSWEDR